MKAATGLDALFYPFHLCHQDTLDRLLRRFRTVHFRDFMALQLTPLTGLTAYPDRMGDSNPELIGSGRLVQGHNVSGPVPREVAVMIDRDLTDPDWRSLFHKALTSDLRFRRGVAHDERAEWIRSERYASAAYSLAWMKRASSRMEQDGYPGKVEYGLALVKTSAALVYTVELARAHGLHAVTDSPAHFGLLERSCRRGGTRLANHLVLRQGY